MKKLSDEELIEKYRGGHANSLDVLISRYLSYVRSKARSYFLIGGEREDLVQEGMIGLFKAIRDFNPQKNMRFKTFAHLCVSRQLATALKQSNRFKNKALNTYVSFYQDYNQDLKVKDILEGGGQSPEQILIDKESAYALINVINEKLSNLEKNVLHKYITGLSYGEIAAQLNITNKAIDNALQRIKKKLSINHDGK